MGYARQNGETTEQYVDRLRAEASAGTIASGPGGTMVQNAIDAARGFGPGSGGRPENRSDAVSKSYFDANATAGAAPTNPIYAAVNGPLSHAVNQPATPTGTGVTHMPGTGNPLTVSGDNIDAARRGILYSLSDPEFALQNALTDQGISTYNPIINRGILPAARGLASAYTLQGANDPNAGPGTDVASGFKNFLAQVLGGSGAGGIMGTVGSALGTLRSPEMSSKLGNAANLQNAGVAPENPFLAGLLGLLSSPESFAGMQGSLSLPLLGSSLSQSLSQLQGLNVARAYRNAPATAPNSFIEYLMGRGGQ